MCTFIDNLTGFNSSGLTIDTTAANLVPSSDVASFRGRRSLGQSARKRRQLRNGENNHGRNQWLQNAIVNARKLMTVMPIVTNKTSSILEDTAVPEQVAQEIVIKGRNITHIAAGPYAGLLKGHRAICHQYF